MLLSQPYTIMPKKQRHCLQCGSLLLSGDPSDWCSEPRAQVWDMVQREKFRESGEEKLEADIAISAAMIHHD